MRLINGAFQTIMQSGVADRAPWESQESKAPSSSNAAPPWGASLTPEERQRFVDTINDRRSFLEGLRDDPWNRGLSLVIALLHGVQVFASLMRGTPLAPTSVFTIVASPVLLHYAWSDETSRRVFGWFWLLLFAVFMPWFTSYMRLRL
jgi:hypothetical protein